MKPTSVTSSSPVPSVPLAEVKIKRFFFPGGEPLSPTTEQKELSMIRTHFGLQEGLLRDNLYEVTSQVCGLSSYCNDSLYMKILEHNNVEAKIDSGKRITEQMFLSYWKADLERAEPVTRLFRILKKSDKNYLTRPDFHTLVQEIVNRHPGLEFLEATPEFQLRYAQTVVARVFYQVNTTGSERISLSELKKSNFLQMLHMLDQEEDINKINDYFSYEHFYVIYCKFWELDQDHDFLIDKNDLARYNDYALTSRVIERVAAGCARKLLSGTPGVLSYEDFIVFLISEVDKTSDVALDYWFKVIDVEGDGFLDIYEMEYFFKEQQARMQSVSSEDVQYQDILCQLVDMIHPNSGTSVINREDISRSRMGPLFFNVLFNLGKFLLYEQRDPNRIRQQRMHPQLSEWDRYAIAGYYHLAEADQEDNRTEWEQDGAQEVDKYIDEEDDTEEDESDHDEHHDTFGNKRAGAGAGSLRVR